LVHGTTVATNALLERKVAKTGLITTRGFRDVLEMRRRDRAQTWGLKGSFVPIIPRDLRLEVDERVLASGEIHTEVNIEQVRTQAKHLLAQGCEAICVFFVNAYANPLNELRAKACIEEFWPNAHVSVATQVLPEIREFERRFAAGGGGLFVELGEHLGTRGVFGRALDCAKQWGRDVGLDRRRVPRSHGTLGSCCGRDRVCGNRQSGRVSQCHHG